MERFYAYLLRVMHMYGIYLFLALQHKCCSHGPIACSKTKMFHLDTVCLKNYEGEKNSMTRPRQP